MDLPSTINSMEILADTWAQMGKTRGTADLRAEARERKAMSSEAFSIRENREFYERYMSVFRNGVFRLHRSEFRHDSETSTRINRSYFSGALDYRTLRKAISSSSSRPTVPSSKPE